MTIPDILISTAISMVTGFTTGEYFASKSSRMNNSMNNITYVVNYTAESSPGIVNKTNSNFDFFLLLLILATSYFAHNYPQILSYGWILITFSGTSVLTFVAVSFLRDKYISKWGIWCIACLVAIIYIYWVLNRSLAKTAYISYINKVQMTGTEAIIFSSPWLTILYQLTGLILLISIIIAVIIQSFAILLQPIAYQSIIVFHVFNFCNRFLRVSFAGFEALILLMSFAFVSGKIFILLAALNHLRI